MPATASTPMASSASTSAREWMPPATMSCLVVARAQRGRDIEREALHCALGVHVGVEEGGAEVLEPGDGLLRREVDGVLPSLDGDAAVLGVDGEAEGAFAERALQLLGEFEADDFVAARGRPGLDSER